MPSQNSTETIVKQLSSGILSGGVIGVLFGRGHYALSCLTFTSVGLFDFAYHLNYLKPHITHLTFEEYGNVRTIKSRLNNFQRNIQRNLRDPLDDGTNQEAEWLLNDILGYIERHMFYGMGFAAAFLLSVVLVPKARR